MKFIHVGTNLDLKWDNMCLVTHQNKELATWDIQCKDNSKSFINMAAVAKIVP